MTELSTALGHRFSLPPIVDPESCLGDLPRTLGPWPEAGSEQIASCLAKTQMHGGWHWPDRPIVFVSDPHADAEGFLRSLIGAGVIRRDRHKISLTPFGQQARIILGGDSLDKGPSNLALLDAIADVIDAGAHVQILAGNHDLRMRMAIGSVQGERTVLNEHLFVRMGRKILPALQEVLGRFATDEDLAKAPDEAKCRAQLLPRENWSERFSQAARAELPQKAIRKEVHKLEEKLAKFDTDRLSVGLSYRELLVSLRKCHQIFFEPDSHYGWFYQRMDVVARSGSLLFVHAGLCDTMCDALAANGIEAVNAEYRAGADAATLGFYFGPLANLVRTKYRGTDCALTDQGVRALHQAGLHMVVQGHVNNHEGQRLCAKKGLLHLEGDITLDRTSRALEGLDGIGTGATLIFPTGDVIGLSRDYPWAKHFAPERMN